MNRRGLFSQRFENQKGFSPLFIILGIILVIGIASGAYYLGTRKASTPSSTPIPVATFQTPQPTMPQSMPVPSATDETIGWKTYTNTTYGFSLKYPSQLTVSNESQNKDGLYVELSQPNWTLPRMTISLGGNSTDVQGSLTDLHTILSTKKLGDYTYSLISTQDINGQSLYVFSEDWDSSGKIPKLPPAGGPLSKLVAMGVLKNHIYDINYLYEDLSKKEFINQDQKIFIQIISTFKFTQ